MTLPAIQSLPAMQPSRKPRIILIFLIALCGLFVYSYAARLGEKASLETQIVAMEAQIAAAQNEQLQLQAQQERLNEPDFLDDAARTLFDHALPGDRVIVIVDEPTGQDGAESMSVAGEGATNRDVFYNFPIWQQWVVFFTNDSFAVSLR